MLRTVPFVALLSLQSACHRTERAAPVDAETPKPLTSASASVSASASAAPARHAAAPPRFKSLAPVSTLKNPPASRSAIYVLGDLVTVVGHDAEARVYKVGSDAPIATLAHTESSSSVGRVENDLLLVSDVKKLSAYDARTLKKRWTTALPTLSSASGAVSGPGFVAFLASFEGGGELVGLDLVSGAIKWRKPLYFQAKLASSGSLVVASYNSETTCFDGLTGEVKWERKKDWPFDLAAADRSRLVYRSVTSITTRDPVTGADSKTFPLSNTTIDSSLAGDLLVGSSNGELFAMDLNNGAHWTWSRPKRPSSTGLTTIDYVAESVITDDDALYVPGGDGVLRVHERSDGSARWSWPLYGGGAIGVVHEPELALYAASAHDRVLVFKEGTRAPEHATIRGTVKVDGKPKSGVEVLVADKTVNADADGKFSVEIDSVGVAGVWFEAYVGRCVAADSEFVELSGKGSYDVALKGSTAFCSKK